MTQMEVLLFLQYICLWVVLCDKGLCTVIQEEIPEGSAISLSCGRYCEQNHCECRRTDWYWTDEKRPQQFVTAQIWARLTGASFHLNSVCHDGFSRLILLTGLQLKISPVSRSDDGRTYCCYTGEIQFDEPLLFCTSLTVVSNDSLWLFPLDNPQAFKVSISVVLITVAVAGISCVTCCVYLVKRRRKRLRRQDRRSRRRRRRQRSPDNGDSGSSSHGDTDHNLPQTCSSSVVVHMTPISTSWDEQTDQDAADATTREDNWQSEGSRYDDFEYYLYESMEFHGGCPSTVGPDS